MDWGNCFGRHRLLHLSERTRQPPVPPCTLCFMHGFTSLLQCDTTGCACGGGDYSSFPGLGYRAFHCSLAPLLPTHNHCVQEPSRNTAWRSSELPCPWQGQQGQFREKRKIMMIVSWGGPLKINYEITEWHKGSFVFKNAESTEKLPILSCGTSP